MLKISAVIINYNSSEYTVKCIESILKHTADTFAYELIIVDNNSDYKDFEVVNNYVSQLESNKISLHRSKINKGFGGGNMHGLQYASPSEYVAFINNDTLFLNDCFDILYQYISSQKNIGIVGGQSYDQHDRPIISFDHYASTTRQIFGRSILEKLQPSQHPKRKKNYTNPLVVQTVSGSFMLVDTQSFHEVGGFDENLFLYYEETDLCLRLAKIGKICSIVPEAKYLHYHGASTEKSDAIKKELKISLVYLVQKHYGLLSKKVLLSYLCIITFLASLVKPKKWSFLSLYIQGAPLSKSLKVKQKIANQ